MEFLLEMDFLSMTDGYSKRNCWDETWKLFDSMSVEGNVEPEEVTMIAARSACSQKGGLRLGKSFHEYVKLEMQITMNVKCGCLDSARGIFDTMGVRDVFSWTSMVNGYAKSCELELARMSFNEMPERNVVSWSAMIAGQPPKGSFRMVCNMLEAAFVPLENISSCALCLWSIGLLGIWWPVTGSPEQRTILKNSCSRTAFSYKQIHPYTGTTS